MYQLYYAYDKMTYKILLAWDFTCLTSLLLLDNLYKSIKTLGQVKNCKSPKRINGINH